MSFPGKEFMGDSSSSRPTTKRIFLAKVIEDRARDSTFIKISLIEQDPGAVGEFAAASNVSTVELKDHNDQKIQSTTETSNYVEAEYLGESNIAYPPMVRKGENVEVYTFSDPDRYYWLPYRTDHDLRRNDVLRLFVPSVPDGELKVTKTDENSYFIEFNGIDKTIKLQTSKAAGEPYAYSITYEPMKSQLVVADDIGNMFSIHSNVPQVIMQNANGGYVDIIKNNVVSYAPHENIITAGKRIVFKAPGYSFRGVRLRGSASGSALNTGLGIIGGKDSPTYNDEFYQRQFDDDGVSEMEFGSVKIRAKHSFIMESPVTQFLTEFKLVGDMVTSGAIQHQAGITQKSYTYHYYGAQVTYRAPLDNDDVFDYYWSFPTNVPEIVKVERPEPLPRHATAWEPLVDVLTGIINGLSAYTGDDYSDLLSRLEELRMPQLRGL